MILRAALIWLALSGAAMAETDAAAAARAAAGDLTDAAQMLDAAKSARNRVKALTQTVQAYEDGLRAMRDGMRRAAVQEQALTAELRAREAEISRLLGVLQSISNTPAPVLLLHPAGPVGSARSGMIVSEVTPALATQAEALQSKLTDLSILRALQHSAADKLRDGLTGAQTARVALSQAIANRTDLPRRFTEDSIKTALLIASTETLEGFASGLSDIAVDEAPGSLPDIADRKGALPLPARGRVLRRAGEPDAAGVSRPGIVLATLPHTLVTTPTAATIRYRGQLLDYGNVVVLEPQVGILLVLAGLDVVYGEPGEVVPGGSPVGLMGGPQATPDAILIENAQGAGAERTETLYIELRENNAPVDPAAWFKIDKQG